MADGMRVILENLDLSGSSILVIKGPGAGDVAEAIVDMDTSGLPPIPIIIARDGVELWGLDEKDLNMAGWFKGEKS